MIAEILKFGAAEENLFEDVVVLWTESDQNNVFKNRYGITFWPCCFAC